MSKPINYYIQLSDEFSTAIDAMNSEQLISLAEDLLVFRRRQDSTEQGVMYGKDLTDTQAVQLAYGCLAKAV